MPVFRINLVFADGKGYKGHHIVEGVELDTYYRHLFRLAQGTQIPIVTFDVVQVSEFSREATFMRENNLKKRILPYIANTRPMRGTGKRRRRL